MDGRRARRLFAAGLMSDTKWRKLFRLVQAACPDVDAMSVKFVAVEHPRRMRFPPSLSCPRPYMDTIEFGPTELRAIEWLEIGRDLRGVLEPHGRLPLTVDGGVTRIVGYTGSAAGHEASVRGAGRRCNGRSLMQGAG